MAYSQAWLEDPASIRKVFIIADVYDVVAAATIQIYLSNTAYMTDDRITFLPIIVGSVTLQESMSIDNSQASMSFGTVTLDNSSGEYDDYLDITKYIWQNRDVQVYYGDPFWASATIASFKTDFKLVFSGIVENIDSQSRTQLSLKLRDKLQKFNTAITETDLSTTGDISTIQPLQDTIIPVVLGEVFNINIPLVRPGSLRYFMHDGVIERVVEIRDNGVPLYTTDNLDTGWAGTLNLTNVAVTATYTSYTTTNLVVNSTTGILVGMNITGTGFSSNQTVLAVIDATNLTMSAIPDVTPSGTLTFTNKSSYVELARSAAGVITATIQGDKRSVNLTTGVLDAANYQNTAPHLIALLATQYGTVDSKITSSEIDLVNFQEVATARPYSLGIYISNRDNLFTLCQTIASSIGSQLTSTREGKLYLHTIGVPKTLDLSITTITDDDIASKSLSISNRTQVVGATKINYCKNWSMQPDLLTLIPQAHKEIFSKPSNSAIYADDAICTLYKTTKDPVGKDTYLVSRDDALTEATRLNAYYSQQRTVYRFKGFARLLSLQLGQQVTLTHARFGLNSGKVGQVTSLSPNWTDSTIQVEVII